MPYHAINLQVRQESNPQPPVLETGALPIELLTYGYEATWFHDERYVPGTSGNICAAPYGRGVTVDS